MFGVVVVIYGWGYVILGGMNFVKFKFGVNINSFLLFGLGSFELFFN